MGRGRRETVRSTASLISQAGAGNAPRTSLAATDQPMHAFPPWFWFVVAGVQFWYVTAPAAVALLLLGWYGAILLGILSWIALGAGAVLTLPFLMSALMYAVQSAEAGRRWRTLDHAETVANVVLPARSRIRFADKAHTEFISVDLPGVTEIMGIRFAGHLTRYDAWDD